MKKGKSNIIQVQIFESFPYNHFLDSYNLETILPHYYRINTNNFQ